MYAVLIIVIIMIILIVKLSMNKDNLIEIVYNRSSWRCTNGNVYSIADMVTIDKKQTYSHI